MPIWHMIFRDEAMTTVFLLLRDHSWRRVSGPFQKGIERFDLRCKRQSLDPKP